MFRIPSVLHHQSETLRLCRRLLNITPKLSPCTTREMVIIRKHKRFQTKPNIQANSYMPQDAIPITCPCNHTIL